MKDRTRNRKLLLTLGVAGVVTGLIVLGTFAAFTATTTNSGNTIESGTVKIDQHVGATTLYDVDDQEPGDFTEACVRVTYSGSLTADVKLYVSSGITNGALYNLKVERGSGLTGPAADMNCTGFGASSIAYDGALGSFGTDWGTGEDGKAGAATWATGESVDYRFTITQNDDSTPNAHTSVTSSGAHTFTWEARNN
jgi:predicted ribosomally synthesized peptide with SipW-like signal peptide